MLSVRPAAAASTGAVAVVVVIAVAAFRASEDEPVAPLVVVTARLADEQLGLGGFVFLLCDLKKKKKMPLQVLHHVRVGGGGGGGGGERGHLRTTLNSATAFACEGDAAVSLAGRRAAGQRTICHLSV